MLVGNSHTRGSTIRVREYLGKKYEVYCTLKPGASAVNLITQSSQEFKHLTKKIRNCVIWRFQ
jgi:hypothetical protein